MVWIAAADKSTFIPKGSSSSTHATCGFVRLSPCHADQARTIRSLFSMVKPLNKLVREQRNLLQELGQDPTPEQIAERMDMTPDKSEIWRLPKSLFLWNASRGKKTCYLGDSSEDEVIGKSSADYTTRAVLREQLGWSPSIPWQTAVEENVLRLRFLVWWWKMRAFEDVSVPS